MIRTEISDCLQRTLSPRREIVRGKLNKTVENLIIGITGLSSGKNEELSDLGEAIACCPASLLKEGRKSFDTGR